MYVEYNVHCEKGGFMCACIHSFSYILTAQHSGNQNLAYVHSSACLLHMLM